MSNPESGGGPSGFDDFVPLPSNRDALAAARRWARPRARTANPLVLVGPSAVGKSHLACAALQRFAVAYGAHGTLRTTVELVLNAIFAAHRAGSRADFRRQLRDTRAIVIEHVEDLVGRPTAAGVIFEMIGDVIMRGCPVLLPVTSARGQGRLRLPATSRVVRITRANAGEQRLLEHRRLVESLRADEAR